MNWISVKFDFDFNKTNIIRHRKTGKVLRRETIKTGLTSTCSTSIPEAEKDNALNYILTHSDYQQFRELNPRNLIINHL